MDLFCPVEFKTQKLVTLQIKGTLKYPLIKLREIRDIIGEFQCNVKEHIETIWLYDSEHYEQPHSFIYWDGLVEVLLKSPSEFAMQLYEIISDFLEREREEQFHREIIEAKNKQTAEQRLEWRKKLEEENDELEEPEENTVLSLGSESHAIQDRITKSAYKDTLQTHIDQDQKIWFAARHVGSLLELKNIRAIIQSYDANEKNIFNIKTSGGRQDAVFLSLNGLKRLLVRSRKTKANELAKLIGIDIVDTKYTCIESDVISSIEYALEGYKMIKQYSIGKYFIDLYIPEYRLAIECDENGHLCRVEQDKEREEEIKKLIPGIKFIRIKPESEGFNMFKVINSIYKYLNE